MPSNQADIPPMVRQLAKMICRRPHARKVIAALSTRRGVEHEHARADCFERDRI